MATGNEPDIVWVERLDVVQWSIGELTHKRVHPFFIAYLHLRSRAKSEGDESDIQPRWSDLGNYLWMPGGPPKKPFYRPLFDPPGNRSRYWLNENLAGSYSPSSLRDGQPPMRVVSRGANGGFSLRLNHAALALHHLLYDERLAIYPFVSFLYRDFGVVTSGSRPDPSALADIFREDWHFTRDDDPDNDFETLFDLNGADLPSNPFEAF